MARPHRRSAKLDLLVDDRRVKEIARLLKKPKRTLADYHKIGKKFGELTADPAVTVGGTKWKEEVTKRVGASEATLNKCLQFSRAYEPGELKELEELEDRWARITVSLAVKDRGGEPEARQPLGAGVGGGAGAEPGRPRGIGIG
jgi:hypothetical protein